MQLSIFLEELFTTGEVTVEPGISPLEAADLAASGIILRKQYDHRVLEFAGAAPVWQEDAAVWAAAYLLRATQLSILRDEGEEQVRDQLSAFSGKQDAATIFSADICLVYLPELWQLAQGLAPQDVLVKQLSQTAADWPFSSIGIEIPAAVPGDWFTESPDLARAYANRIIQQKDQRRAAHPPVDEYIREILGEQGSLLWPELLLPH
ncbi:MAG: hypothetical protein QM781_00425 [Chitinophagaceae bacterium]